MLIAPPAERNAQCVICITHKVAARVVVSAPPVIAKSPCKLLVAEPALVPRRAHLLLVAEHLQVLGSDIDQWRFRRGRRSDLLRLFQTPRRADPLWPLTTV